MFTAFSIHLTAVTESDPITALLEGDWASLGGWSMFVFLGVYIVLGAVREWWVPGRRYRRLEESSIEMTKANDELRQQNSMLIAANDITKHFFEETVPRRGEPRT